MNEVGPAEGSLKRALCSSLRGLGRLLRVRNTGQRASDGVQPAAPGPARDQRLWVVMTSKPSGRGGGRPGWNPHINTCRCLQGLGA